MAARRSVTWALRRGQRLARAGKLDESLDAFGAADDANDRRLLIRHALTLVRAGESEAALEKSAKAATLAPGDVVPALFNAYLLLRAGRLDQAEAELKRATKLSPKNPLVRSLSAAAEVLRGNLAEGCQSLSDGPISDNLEVLGWILAVVERKIFEAVGTDSGAIPPEPEERGGADKPPEEIPALSAAACAKRGRRLLEAAKPMSALKYLARAVELKPDDADGRAMYGAALFEAGEFERAEVELAQAPEKGPLSGVGQFYRAANSYRLGRHEAAIEFIDTLPQVGDVVLYQEWCDYIRGMALVALGRTDEAGKHLAAFIDAESSLFEQRLQKAIEISGEEQECSTQS